MSAETPQFDDAPEPFPRRVELPDGRSVTVRPAEPDDAEAIAEMYAELSDEDTYLRFFTPRRPDLSLFEREVAVAESGGVALVAEVNEGGQREIVGDVWYSMLPDGNGEFAIAVAEPWRGRLGAYLLDTLLDIAAERGIPNLEAEILLRNRPMLSLVRRRGSVVMGDDGPSVRVSVGSGGQPASWPPRHDRPRVLVEGCGGARSLEVADRAGLDVIQCPGPGTRESCPLLAGGNCPLVEGADAIVVSLPSSDERTRALLRAHQGSPRDVPLFIDGVVDGIIGISDGTADDIKDDDRIEVLSRSMSDHEAVARIIRALTRGHDELTHGDDS